MSQTTRRRTTTGEAELELVSPDATTETLGAMLNQIMKTVAVQYEVLHQLAEALSPVLRPVDKADDDNARGKELPPDLNCSPLYEELFGVLRSIEKNTSGIQALIDHSQL